MLAALVVSLCALTAARVSRAQSTSAQAQTLARPESEWVAVSPEGEGFNVRMPTLPVTVAQRVQSNGLDASGTRYATASDERTSFVIWSMKGSDANGPLGPGGYAGKSFPGGAAYLDAVDELAWELLIAPEFVRLARERVSRQRVAEMRLGMVYKGEFELSGMPARQFYVGLESGRGLVYVCGEGSRVYVVAALGADDRDARLKQFLDSFALKVGAPPSTAPGVGLGPGRGSNTGGDAAVDYSKPFKPGDVTKKSVITGKPEPGFTEEARKFSVTGTVRLRAVLAATGEVTNIFIIKGLPHGLTEKAVAAANRILFIPAEKNGRKVSQYVTLEYNFNIY
jgi:TonB family protein